MSIQSLPSRDEKSLVLLPYLSIRKILGQIYMIGVDPDCQRRGIGTALINAGSEIVKQRGFALVKIETGGDSGHAAARKTYERNGL